ncbi:hypothetical protein [Pseudomonas sp. B14-6]|uniref:hypothetical protein n=1 Tax=Pseudomonas sp. B14-6 TaxID=2738843 RepID=UPI003558935F
MALAPGDKVWYTPARKLCRVPRCCRKHYREEVSLAEPSLGGKPEPGLRNGGGASSLAI